MGTTDETKTIEQLLQKVRAGSADIPIAGENIVAAGVLSGSAHSGAIADAFDAFGSKFGVVRRLKERKADVPTDPFAEASHVAMTSNRMLLLKRHGDLFSLVHSTRLADITAIELSGAGGSTHSNQGCITFSFRTGPSVELAMSPGQAASLRDAWRVPSAIL